MNFYHTVSVDTEGHMAAASNEIAGKTILLRLKKYIFLFIIHQFSIGRFMFTFIIQVAVGYVVSTWSGEIILGKFCMWFYPVTLR